jgi:CxxC motif-containing protein (DUF1111 family)
LAEVLLACGPALPQRALDPANAFALPSAELDSAQLAKFNYGRGLFHHVWLPVEHADGTSGGLGPLFNANSCAACHVNDGRGVPSQTLVLALFGAEGQDPVYGAQLQDQSLEGLSAEGEVEITFSDWPVDLPDGGQVILRRPVYSIASAGLGALDPHTVLAPRIAPPLIGLGLLEAVPLEILMELADPQDRNGDGISGTLHMVSDPETGLPVPGRFGWMASVPGLEDQIAIAAHKDMGLSSPAFLTPFGDCTDVHRSCISRATPDGELDLSANDVALLGDYLRFLGVPPRRNESAPKVVQGEALFSGIGCADCHLPELETGADAEPFLVSRRFAAFTDLLLHDMGRGLADDGQTGNAEWRTAPLWGIGLTEAVTGDTHFLHDARAESLIEAIYWHGGEAEAVRNTFAALDPEDRDALLAVLKSL